MGQAYSQITLLFCIGQFFASMGARLLQATGNAGLSMATQLMGTVLNCVLDPIMIFGWLGFPAMGIRGAAIATVLSQCVSGGLSTGLYFVKNPSLRLHRQDLRVRFDLAGEIYRAAVPMMVTMALNSILLMVTNRILQNISNTAIAFYGVFSKLQNFMFMPVNGLSQGIVPVIGYFYGAKNGEKIRSAVSFALKLGVGVMAVGSVIFCLFPVLLMSLYAPSPEMLAVGRVGLRLLAISFIPLAFVLIFGNVFTAMGNGLVNMRCSMVRGILPIPLLLLLIRFTGTSWCWLAFVLADCIAAVYAIRCYHKIRHSKAPYLEL